MINPATGLASSGGSGYVRGHWRSLVGSEILIFVVLVYGYAAAAVLPQLLVSLTADKADANTQLTAVTSTRGALLGLIAPVVLLFGGIAAILNYQETTEQNRRANERDR